MELIKNSREYILLEICNSLYNTVENQVNEINFGHLILLPIQKPNKEKSPPKNLRPLNLLNKMRKTLSMITMIIYHTVNQLTELIYQQQR